MFRTIIAAIIVATAVGCQEKPVTPPSRPLCEMPGVCALIVRGPSNRTVYAVDCDGKQYGDIVAAIILLDKGEDRYGRGCLTDRQKSAMLVAIHRKSR